jgi:GntR family transcriptional regulator, gluconate operon transcriptional repressor
MIETQLPSLNRKVLWKEAAEAIRYAIIRGDLSDGERVTEDGLAQRLGVSRMTIHSAFKQLAQEGLLTESEPGVRRVSFGEKDREELFEMRAILECHAVQAACWAEAGEGLSELRSIVLKMALVAPEAGAGREIARLDMAFHRTIIKTIRHNRLESAWENLAAIIEASLVLGNLEGGDRNVIASEHLAILEALEQGSYERANEALISHLECSNKRLVNAASSAGLARRLDRS